MGVKLKPFRSKTVYELLVGWGGLKREMGQRNDETSKKAREAVSSQVVGTSRKGAPTDPTTTITAQAWAH
jgi:hypothetical protein